MIKEGVIEHLKQKTKKFVFNLELDENDFEQMESYRYEPATYSWNGPACDASEDWDYDEEVQMKKDKAINIIKDCGWIEVDMSFEDEDLTDEDEEQIANILIEYIEKEL